MRRLLLNDYECQKNNAVIFIRSPKPPVFFISIPFKHEMNNKLRDIFIHDRRDQPKVEYSLTSLIKR